MGFQGAAGRSNIAEHDFGFDGDVLAHDQRGGTLGDAHDGNVGEGHLCGILDGIEEQGGFGGGSIGHVHVEIDGEGHVHAATALAGRAGGARAGVGARAREHVAGLARAFARTTGQVLVEQQLGADRHVGAGRGPRVDACRLAGAARRGEVAKNEGGASRHFSAIKARTASGQRCGTRD